MTLLLTLISHSTLLHPTPFHFHFFPAASAFPTRLSLSLSLSLSHTHTHTHTLSLYLSLSLSLSLSSVSFIRGSLLSSTPLRYGSQDPTTKYWRTHSSPRSLASLVRGIATRYSSVSISWGGSSCTLAFTFPKQVCWLIRFRDGVVTTLVTTLVTNVCADK
jgi:hypothetical protein